MQFTKPIEVSVAPEYEDISFQEAMQDVQPAIISHSFTGKAVGLTDSNDIVVIDTDGFFRIIEKSRVRALNYAKI